jgi:NOL1/NOP2/sun family putative RNA methylase
LKTIIFPASADSSKLASKYGYDEWLVSRFMQYVPDVERFLAKMDARPTQYIRVNTLKIEPESLAERLTSKGFELRPTFLSEVFAILRAPFSVGATTEYLLGYYYVQDLGSCVPVDAMELDSGSDLVVMDMAAAPGGKTTFISQKMKNAGVVVALEPQEKRLRSLVFNLARCGVTNTCVYLMDGGRANDLKLKFDRVLLDAPCSCEGVIPKDMLRKTSHKPDDIDYCADRQKMLIEAAAGLVKPGGLLIYSTCSFAPEENEMIVDWLLGRINNRAGGENKARNARIEPLPHGNSGLTRFGGSTFDDNLKNARRFYPHIDDTLGFFVAKIRIR